MDWEKFFPALTAMLIVVIPLVTVQVVQVLLALSKARSDRLAQDAAAKAAREVKDSLGTLKHQTDGLTEQLVKATETAAFKEGVKSEQERTK